MNYKIFVLAVVSTIIFLFTGCSSSIAVGLSALPDGSIRQQYVINLNQNELKEHYTTDEIQTIFLVTKSCVDTYLSNFEKRATECARLNGYLIMPFSTENKIDNNELTIQATIYYANSAFYKLLNEYLSGGSTEEGEGSEEENTTETTNVEEGLFYDKIILMQQINPVADDESIQTIYTTIESELDKQGIDFKFNISQINLSYDYAIPYTDAQVNRIRSDADEEYVVTEVNTVTGASYNMKHYVWQYDVDGDNTITLYRYKVNSVMWYILALCLVAVFAVALLVGYYVKKRMNKNKVQTVDNATNNIDNDQNINKN